MDILHFHIPGECDSWTSLFYEDEAFTNLALLFTCLSLKKKVLCEIGFKD